MALGVALVLVVHEVEEELFFLHGGAGEDALVSHAVGEGAAAGEAVAFGGVGVGQLGHVGEDGGGVTGVTALGGATVPKIMKLLF